MLNIIAPGMPDKINNIPEPFRSFVSSCIIKDAGERANDISDLIFILKNNTGNIFSATGNANAAPETPATVYSNKTAISDDPAAMEEIPVMKTDIVKVPGRNYPQIYRQLRKHQQNLRLQKKPG